MADEYLDSSTNRGLNTHPLPRGLPPISAWAGTFTSLNVVPSRFATSRT